MQEHIPSQLKSDQVLSRVRSPPLLVALLGCNRLTTQSSNEQRKSIETYRSCEAAALRVETLASVIILTSRVSGRYPIQSGQKGTSYLTLHSKFCVHYNSSILVPRPPLPRHNLEAQ